MVICPDCKHKNVGIIYCQKCGSELYRKGHEHGGFQRFTRNLDRLIGNSVYSK